jgi:hypothetical protein
MEMHRNVECSSRCVTSTMNVSYEVPKESLGKTVFDVGKKRGTLVNTMKEKPNILEQVKSQRENLTFTKALVTVLS